jgi:dehydrogenase/reductase SDR family protein 12
VSLPGRLLDGALDRSVVLGYGNLGLAVRRRLPGWPAEPPRMDGRVVLVTGAAGGLGAAAAVGFARLGARVHVHGRSPERASDGARTVADAVPDADIVPEACDLADPAAVRRFAAELAGRLPRLDVIVHNAGVMPAQRTHTDGGHELMFATHVLALHALAGGLADRLGRTPPGRILTVSSGGMYGQSLPAADDPESERVDYRPAAHYARTKRQQVVLTELWAERLSGAGVVVHAMHPGWADTAGVRDSMPGFHTVTRPILRTAAEGADTIVWLGAAPAAVACSGRFWQDRRPRPTRFPFGPGDGTPANRAALWAYCERALADA